MNETAWAIEQNVRERDYDFINDPQPVSYW